MSDTASRPAEAPVLTIDEFIRDFRLSRTSTYEELKHGRLKAVKVGRRTMIRRVDAEAWLESLAAYSPRSVA